MTSIQNRSAVRAVARTRRTTGKKKSRARAVIATATALTAATALTRNTARATDFYWDNNGSAAGAGGSGTWDTTTPNWAPSPGGTAATGNWTDDANNNAIFQAPVTPTSNTATVTVSGARTLG